MARYLFSSHDGFGLGHVRRNTLVARTILDRDPQAHVCVVTGLAVRPSWVGDPRTTVVRVPALVKDSGGAYRNDELDFEDAVAQRAEAFVQAVRTTRPDVVVVDRHPFGVAGELAPGLALARRQGAAVVLGLRDVLDEPAVVRQELAGAGWRDVPDVYDELLVYGDPVLCDQEREHGLPMRPRYCGWVVDRPHPRRRDPELVVVSAGGGGDGEAVFAIGARLGELLPRHRIVIVAGPYAGGRTLDDPAAGRPGRVAVVRDSPGCAQLFARAVASVQMAGYNSTFEALAAGVRPVLVPRRSPRREQALRACRLAAMGLADVVDEQAPAEEVAWLLRRDRLLPPDAPARAGIHLDGAHRAAAILASLVAPRVRVAR